MSKFDTALIHMSYKHMIVHYESAGENKYQLWCNCCKRKYMCCGMQY